MSTRDDSEQKHRGPQRADCFPLPSPAPGRQSCSVQVGEVGAWSGAQRGAPARLPLKPLRLLWVSPGPQPHHRAQKDKPRAPGSRVIGEVGKHRGATAATALASQEPSSHTPPGSPAWRLSSGCCYSPLGAMTEANDPQISATEDNEKHCLHFCGSGIGEQLMGWPWLWVSQEVSVKPGAGAASLQGTGASRAVSLLPSFCWTENERVAPRPSPTARSEVRGASRGSRRRFVGLSSPVVPGHVSPR